jgi:chorismate dehydratase
LRERFGVQPSVTPAAPVLATMLQDNDAALIIGDPALRIQPEETNLEWLDLGQEWFRLTKLPMVFAVWAGRSPLAVDELSRLTRDSFEFGKARVDEIVESEYRGRGITKQLADDYLRHSIRFEIGPSEQLGLEAFFELAKLTEGAKL